MRLSTIITIAITALAGLTTGSFYMAAKAQGLQEMLYNIGYGITFFILTTILALPKALSWARS